MDKTIKPKVKNLLRIDNGLFFTIPENFCLWNLVIHKEGRNIVILPDNGEVNGYDFGLYLELPESDICNYFNVKKATGELVIQYIKARAKIAKHYIVMAKVEGTWDEEKQNLRYDLILFANAIQFAEAYRNIQEENESLEAFLVGISHNLIN